MSQWYLRYVCTWAEKWLKLWWTPELQNYWAKNHEWQLNTEWKCTCRDTPAEPQMHIFFNAESSRCIFSCQPITYWRELFSLWAENTGEWSINSVIYKSTSFACTPIHLSTTWHGIISTDKHRHVIWHAYAALLHLTKLYALLWMKKKKQMDKLQVSQLLFCQVYNHVSAHQRLGVPG